LKQAGRKWYNTLCHSLANVGFKQSMADLAVFYAFVEKEVVVLFIHVDDSTVTGSSSVLNKMFMKQIAEHFEITDLGPISWLLGLAIIQNQKKRTLSLSQGSYIKSLLCYFNLEDAKIVSVSINSDVRLTSCYDFDTKRVLTVK
jgi:Reverse transcriptase (RNA-dependent DNA polymerase)